MESITKELREWAKTLTHWWYDPVKDEYTYTTGIMPPSIDAIRLDSSILAIADRIDAEYEKAIRELNNLADASVLLPVDADGVPIHVGDVMDGNRGTVTCIGDAGHGWEIVTDHMYRYNPADLHHHAPTVEDVLTDLLEEHSDPTCDATPSELAEKYAAKLRLAGDAE